MQKPPASSVPTESPHGDVSDRPALSSADPVEVVGEVPAVDVVVDRGPGCGPAKAAVSAPATRVAEARVMVAGASAATTIVAITDTTNRLMCGGSWNS